MLHWEASHFCIKMGFAWWCYISSLFGFHLAKSFSVIVFLYYLDTEEMAFHVWETFNWRLRSVARPPRPLPENYRDLCLNFIHANAEEATRDFHILELV